MQTDKKWLSRAAAQEGFVRDTLEKVYWLTRVLQYINSNPIMKDCLALKGGTAINLTAFNLPRLSVDVDLDYSKDTDREGMLEDRQRIVEDMEKYMSAEGYQKSVAYNNPLFPAYVVYGFLSSYPDYSSICKPRHGSCGSLYLPYVGLSDAVL